MSSFTDECNATDSSQLTALLLLGRGTGELRGGLVKETFVIFVIL